MKANRIVFLFMGGCWVAAESCGQWVKTDDGESWESASDWVDPDTHSSREYARIFCEGKWEPGKWWHILTQEQKDQIVDFAKSKSDTTIAQEVMRINGDLK